ncbi:hypothetical protein BLA14095_00487 [Burkholderia lata]|uniref:hypothetical protein n=1 Tax=Burkholderia lata (strain ATCC 17760 / DSM 23089 / LMG 22485 / NCIMB 9086 / R18194 / 383) TaxID=482957 RepID=UPI001452BE14|nr:hypothetical protein [Burkholderia lata]VWB16628.1 hypothetical protein BLA14095_00487 [Burkholderia lata]
MAREIVPPERYVEEINKRLPDCHGYQNGLRVFLVPEGADGKTASGYDWTFRRDLGAIGSVSDAVALVDKEFIVDPHISGIGHG